MKAAIIKLGAVKAKLLILCAVMALLGGDSEAETLASPSGSGALHVEGTRLMDCHGNPVILRGVSTHGLAWFPDYVNEDFFGELRSEWKANVIRLAMYTAENGGYCTDGDKEHLKELICDGVEYAKNQDMYVIIDWHVLSDADPNRYLSEAKEFFDEMSERFAGEEHVLYEICNEPNGGTTWQEIKSYAEEVIGVIRANDKDAVILTGTPNWSQFVDEAARDPIEGYENIMYTLHFYAATHKDDLRARLSGAVEAGLPVFVSEYGICDASGNGSIDREQAEEWMELLDQYGISRVAWNLSNKNETSAFFRTDCTKTAGFEESDLSESGQWLYQMLTESAQGGRRAKDKESKESSNAEDKKKEESKRKQEGTGESSASQDGEIVLKGQGVTLHLTMTNSWEAEGETVCQYNLTVENTSDKACEGWEAEIPFQKEFSLKDGWNGEYHKEGDTLRISSKEYNGKIPAGGSVTDVGFIIKGGGGICQK